MGKGFTMATKKTATKAAPAPAPKGDTIPELLKKLAVATGQGEKRAIRRSLRALGHKGGLGKKPVPPKAK
jgi:hypothetical protein